MTVTHARQYTNLDWESYIKLPGRSFSGLRNPDRDATFVPTPKMQLGSAVDCYLFTPEAYNGEMHSLVRPVAKELHKILGEGIKHGQPQLSLTADFNHAGFTLPFRGRPDLKIGGLIVDLKVSELPIHKAIELFRYDIQQSGYTLAARATKAMILSIHPKSCKIQMAMLPVVTDWWELQIKTYGIPQQSVQAY